MNIPACSRSKTVLLMAAVLALSASPARAHVTIDAPNGGEQLEVGSVFSITWRITIQHTLLNWDLWYSTTGAGGPWTPIAMNLPAGSSFPGSIHTYNWTIPAVVDDSVWLRVRMDNSYTDYYDVSNAPFSITPACPWDLDGDGAVGMDDLMVIIDGWGRCPKRALPCPGDIDGDGRVAVPDLLQMLARWGSCQ